MKKVVIVQYQLPHYRVVFFECLREELSRVGVELTLYYSAENSIAAIPGSISWAHPVKAHLIWKLVWIPVFFRVVGADAVIMGSESKHVLNYQLYALSACSKLKVGLWGHGKNFQAANQDVIGERIKRHFSKRVDWWFAYNNYSAEIIHSLGFDESRITSVQNSIDTRGISKARAAIEEKDLRRLKEELGIDSDNVAVFTGRFFRVKRTEFLMKACEAIRQRIPDFHMILIGSGPEQHFVDEATAKHRWIHAVGVKNDVEKAPYWMISKLLLMPGALGLVVLDTFVFGTPMVTTRVTGHGPEVSYLESGRNGLIVDSDPEDVVGYADEVARLMLSADRLQVMRENCFKDASRYSVENMASRFAKGVAEMLDISS